MEDKTSKTNHFDKNEEDRSLHDEGTKSISPKITNVETAKEVIDVNVTTETTETSNNIEESLAAKVKGDSNSDSRLDKNLGGLNENLLENRDPVEDMVRDWESSHPGIKLKRRARKLALLAASLHLYEDRGITVNDLKKLGMRKDNAEMKLYLSKKNDLLVPHETLKIGKQKQYFLTNYKYILDKKEQEKEKYVVDALWDKDLIIQLLETGS